MLKMTEPVTTAKTILKFFTTIPENQMLFFRKMGEQIVMQTPYNQNNSLSEISSIYSNLKRRVRYTLEPDTIETLKTPQAIIRDFFNYGYLVGDCDDLTLLSGLVLFYLGYNVACKIVKQNGEDYFSHIYPIILMPQGYIAFDLCCNEGVGCEIGNITGAKIVY